MRMSLTWIVLALSAFVAAAPSATSSLKIKESIVAPRGWTKREEAPRNRTIDLRIALPQSNFAQLEQNLFEVRSAFSTLALGLNRMLNVCYSDPFHVRYGEHLTHDEVNELVAPHPESVDRVTAWLASHGLSEADLSRSAAGDWLKVTIPISLADDMLDTVSHRGNRS